MTGYDIGFYGSHNAAYAISKNGVIIEVIEIERLINSKNNGIAQYRTFKPTDILFYSKYMGRYLTRRYGIDQFDRCFHQNTEVTIDLVSYKLFEDIPAKEYIDGLHHLSHGAGSFYQSNFKSALVFSFDGGGNDGFFNIYHAKRNKGLKLLEVVNNPESESPHLFLDLGFPYMAFGHYIEEIKQEIDLSAGNLVYPGKLMGLAAFGEVQEEWLPAFYDYYRCINNGDTHMEVISKLGIAIGVVFDKNDRLSEKVGRDIAATSQKAFENVFLEVAKPYFDKYPDLPICIAGGCGLNITLNTRIAEEFGKDVFVGPNPNDCGLAAGMLLNEFKPLDPAIITYSGMEITDLENLGEFIHYGYWFTSSKFKYSELIKDLVAGKIIGVAQGRSEHGPRALGNRSIICNPAFKNMKDILNAKVKNRESYRPFAPVVRLEDVNKYFEWDKASPFMSFSPKVKKEWRQKLKSITHFDNTARIQTVTKEQNRFLYDLLTELDKVTGIGVILNTSFNVAGKPILNTLKDAFTIFEETKMDSLLVEDVYMKKG